MPDDAVETELRGEIEGVFPGRVEFGVWTQSCNRASNGWYGYVSIDRVVKSSYNHLVVQTVQKSQTLKLRALKLSLACPFFCTRSSSSRHCEITFHHYKTKFIARKGTPPQSCHNPLQQSYSYPSQACPSAQQMHVDIARHCHARSRTPIHRCKP